MRKSILIESMCKYHGDNAEHYYYPESGLTHCAVCRREYMRNRRKNSQSVRDYDSAYFNVWSKNNPGKVLKYITESKLKKDKIKHNIKEAKKDFILDNIRMIDRIFNIYGYDFDLKYAMGRIKDINNTTIATIMEDTIRGCRAKKLTMYKASYKQFEKRKIEKLLTESGTKKKKNMLKAIDTKALHRATEKIKEMDIKIIETVVY